MTKRYSLAVTLQTSKHHSWRALLYAVIGTLWLMPHTVFSQDLTNQSDSGNQGTPRNRNGHADLQGVWDFRSLTPLERPDALGQRDTFNAEEAAEFTEERLTALDADKVGPDGRIPLSGGYNDFWYDYGRTLTDDRRTSLVVDPANGQIPALSPSARTRANQRREALQRDAHGPEDRGAFERCILGFNAGPPMNPSAYNNNMQIFQTDNHFVILTEMVHDVRIIPIDGHNHLPERVRQWKGDSKAHWDDDTLVVETKNFTNKTSFRGSGLNMLLNERFTRAAPDTLLYEYTIHDADSFARSWSVAVPMKTSEEPLYEYACHEGNYGMLNLMLSARAEDRKQEATKSQ